MDLPRTNFLKARSRGIAPASPAFSGSGESLVDTGHGHVDHGWRELRPLDIDAAALPDRRIVTLERKDPSHVAFDIMRTKILKTLDRNNWRRIGITSPTTNCGKTLVSANLAFSFAHHLDCRVTLLDLDLRQTGLADLLGTGEAPAMARFLQGESSVEDAFLRHGSNLALGLNGRVESFTTEILHGRETGVALEALDRALEPDVVLVDLPPQRTSDDVLAFLPHLDCVLLVAAAGVSTVGEIDLCERELTEESHLLGVVLNKCHDAGSLTA